MSPQLPQQQQAPPFALSTAAAPSHKTGWRVDLEPHWPSSTTLRPTERRSQAFEHREKGAAPQGKRLVRLPGRWPDPSPISHDTVQLRRVRRGEFLPDAAIAVQFPDCSTPELHPHRQIRRNRQLMASCCHECRLGTAECCTGVGLLFHEVGPAKTREAVLDEHNTGCTSDRLGELGSRQIDGQPSSERGRAVFRRGWRFPLDIEHPSQPRKSPVRRNPICLAVSCKLPGWACAYHICISSMTRDLMWTGILTGAIVAAVTEGNPTTPI